MALVACALCWAVLPKPAMTARAGWALYGKLVAVFMALHYAAVLVYPGGFNVVVTALITCVVARFILLPKQPAD